MGKLTDNPYMPLYVRDWMTSNKLSICSAKAHGILINILCVLHRENDYGRILLKQKFKQSESTCLNFARHLAKILPFDVQEIHEGLAELLDEKILTIEGDYLFSEKMVRLENLSVTRSKAGSKGGKKTQEFAKAKRKANTKAKSQANAETEIETEYEIDNDIKGVDFKKAENALVYPFDTPKFMSAWEAWKKYKAEQHKFKYKSLSTEQAALTELSKLAMTDADAVEIIMQSIGNGWKGFFELKKSNNGKSTDSKDRAARAALHILKTRGYVK